MLEIKDMVAAQRELRFAKLDKSICQVSEALLESICVTDASGNKTLKPEYQTDALELLPNAIATALASRIAGASN